VGKQGERTRSNGGGKLLLLQGGMPARRLGVTQPDATTGRVHNRERHVKSEAKGVGKFNRKSCTPTGLEGGGVNGGGGGRGGGNMWQPEGVKIANTPQA